MEAEVSDSNPSTVAKIQRENSDKDRIRVKRKSLQAVLEQCQRTLELLNSTSDDDDDEEDDGEGEAKAAAESRRLEGSPSMRGDNEADEVNFRLFLI